MVYPMGDYARDHMGTIQGTKQETKRGIIWGNIGGSLIKGDNTGDYIGKNLDNKELYGIIQNHTGHYGTLLYHAGL